MNSRKHKRFCFLLVFYWLLAQAPTGLVFAEFEPLVPQGVLGQEVPVGTITPEQWKSLEDLSHQATLEKPEVEHFS